jgi:hypothetical protein
MHQEFSPALQPVAILIIITPMVSQLRSLRIPFTPKADWHCLLGSNTLLTLMIPSSHCTSTQSFLKARHDEDTMC